MYLIKNGDYFIEISQKIVFIQNKNDIEPVVFAHCTENNLRYKDIKVSIPKKSITFDYIEYFQTEDDVPSHMEWKLIELINCNTNTTTNFNVNGNTIL